LFNFYQKEILITVTVTNILPVPTVKNEEIINIFSVGNQPWFFYAGRLVSSPGASVNDFQPDEQVPCVQLQQVCSASKFIRIHFGLLDPDPEKK
jgi:hypothetical protein